jgi:sugar-specific transcriptional regulator TrmB
MNNLPLEKEKQKEIYEVLSGFGLKKKDQDVYLGLIQIGQSTITPLATAVQLPVTTVQSVLQRLVQKGLVDISKQKTRRVYEANNPSVMKRILEQQAQEVAGVIPFLQELRTEPLLAPQIKIYQRERVRAIFHKALRCKKKLVYEIVSADDFQRIIGEKFHFTRRRVKQKVRLNSLRVESHEIKNYSKKTHERELRKAKFLPSELTFRSSIMFWDDTVAFFTTKEEGLAWTVESKTLVATYKQLFDLLWSIGRRMETKNEEE